MYEDKTKIYRKLRETNNLENHLILRRISPTKLLINKIEMKTSLVNKTLYKKIIYLMLVIIILQHVTPLTCLNP